MDRAKKFELRVLPWYVSGLGSRLDRMDGRMEKRVGGDEGRRGREPVRRPVRPVEEETRLADPRYHDAGDYVSDHGFFQKEPPLLYGATEGKRREY